MVATNHKHGATKDRRHAAKDQNQGTAGRKHTTKHRQDRVTSRHGKAPQPTSKHRRKTRHKTSD
jgi:hypothetical protein